MHSNEGWSELPGFGQYYTPPFNAGSPADAKQMFTDFLKAARDELLTQAGTAIAQTPQGRAAIEQEAMRQATAKARAVGEAAFPWLPVVVIGGILLLTGRR